MQYKHAYTPYRYVYTYVCTYVTSIDELLHTYADTDMHTCMHTANPGVLFPDHVKRRSQAVAKS
jgi:hypothetical protein